MPETLDLADLVFTRAAGPGYTVLDGTVTATPTGAYVTLYYSAGRAYSTRLAGIPQDLRWSFTAVCVGPTRKTALGTVDRIRERFAGWRPFGGNGPQFREIDQDPPLLRDDSVPNDIRFSLTLIYRLYTSRS